MFSFLHVHVTNALFIIPCRTGLTTALVFALWSLSGFANEPAATMSGLRCYAIRPDTFDLLFASSMSGADGKKFSLNHRNGRTYFRKLGDEIEGYVLESFAVVTNRAYSVAVGDYQDQLSGVLTLKDGSGGIYELTEGVALPQEGRMAYLIDLDSGIRWAVRTDASIFYQGEELSVTNIARDSVILAAADGDNLAVPFISDEEKDAYKAKLRERIEKAREAEVARQQSASRAAAEYVRASAPPAPARSASRATSVEIMQPPAMFVGREYPLPTRFEAVPRDGHSYSRGYVLVPTDFEWRRSGISLRLGIGGSSRSGGCTFRGAYSLSSNPFGVW